MAIDKIQSESINLADNFAFTGTVSGAGGITEIDTWFYTASEAISSQYSHNLLSANWSRFNQNSFFEKTGTGMSVSSGIWTFPSTGKYQIIFSPTIATRNGVDSRRSAAVIQATTNNSSYNNYTNVRDSTPYIDSNVTNSNPTAICVLDVTNVSNVKVKLRYGIEATDGQIIGSSSELATGVSFIKLGDT
jgi:hypothetical protein